jgi:hypothetical protein
MKSEVDDWLAELPPLDGAEDEPAAEDGSPDDLLPDEVDDNASLDDANADDLEVDDGVDFADDEPSGGDDDERWEADVGEPELDLADEAGDEAGDGDAPGVAESDLDLDDDDLPPSADDAGEEGTTDSVEHSLDEELPALDADDEGDFEDALLLETGLTIAEPEGPRWAADLWERIPSGDHALAWVVPDDDAVASMAMCVAPERLVSVTVAGRLLVDGAGVDARGGRFLPPALVAAKAGSPLIGLANREGQPVMWVASRRGHVVRSVDLGRSWSERVDTGKRLLALAVTADGLPVLLATQGEGMEILTSSDGVKWHARPVVASGHPGPAPVDGTVWLAFEKSAMAFGDAAGVWVSRDSGEFVQAAAIPGTTAGAFAGNSSSASLLFVEASADVDESARLLRALPAGRLEILAEVAPPELAERAETASVLALAWDDTAQALRAAFSVAVCSIGPRSRR